MAANIRIHGTAGLTFVVPTERGPSAELYEYLKGTIAAAFPNFETLLTSYTYDPLRRQVIVAVNLYDKD